MESMDTGALILGVVTRFLHLGSMAVVVGGLFYAMLGTVDPAAVARYRKWMLGALALLAATGLYTLLTKEGLPKGYHMWFGIKALLALHIITMAFLLGRPGVDAGKLTRWVRSTALSGLMVVLLSSYLRWLTLHP
jgi:hypothetical protein